MVSCSETSCAAMFDSRLWSLIMTKAYPISLRWRVIMSRQRGLSLDQIAETLSVSKTFVKKVIRLYDNSGTVSDPPRRKSKERRISGSWRNWPLKWDAFCKSFVAIDFLRVWIILAAEILVIRRAIEDYPELYLDKLQAWLEYQTGDVYSIQTLSRSLREMGLTVKKVQKTRD